MGWGKNGWVVGALVALAGVTTTGTASAQEPEKAPTAPEPDKGPSKADDDHFRSVALELNPLSYLLMKFGANVEWLPAAHHAITFSPFFQSYTVPGGHGRHSTAFAGEVGYRYYLGTRGADGFWFGPSVIAMRETVKDVDPDASGPVNGLGGAFDLGGQLVSKGGFTIGCGAGLSYVASSAAYIPHTVNEVNRIQARLLFDIGYSF